MSIKKLVIPILAAAILTMGISVVSATDQSDGDLKSLPASKRKKRPALGRFFMSTVS
jgi:hypothetical protein